MQIESKLSEYDYLVVIDTSGSMAEPWRATTRWEAMQESVMTLVRDVEKLDSDGIDVVQLGGDCKHYAGVTSDNVKQMFATMAPRGGTPLAQALSRAFAVAGKSEKKDFILVFTDGVPDSQIDAERVIRDHANKQETDDACTVLFVQVGDDPQATKYLKGLDDNLKGTKFDIVDAITMEEADKFPTTADMVLKAIND